MVVSLDVNLREKENEITQVNFKEKEQLFFNKELPILRQLYPTNDIFYFKMCMNSSEATDLIRQDRIQTSEKPFSCNICGRSFTQAADVTRHTRVHTGEKPYTCSICAKSFTQSGDLTRHSRTHTGEKPFTCSVCTKRFTQSGSLARHLRVHTGEKPFSCAICMRSFSQSGDSIRHIRVHRSSSPVSSRCNSNTTQVTTNLYETPPVTSEQKLMFSDVLSMAFSHNSHPTYACLTPLDPSLEIPKTDSDYDSVLPKSSKRSKMEKFALDTLLFQNKMANFPALSTSNT